MKDALKRSFTRLCELLPDLRIESSGEGGFPDKDLSSLPLGEEVGYMYDLVGHETTFEIPWHGDDIEIFSFVELEEMQRGYRWVSNPSEMREPSWPDSWVRIGHVSFNALIAETHEGFSRISWAGTGEGEWKLRPMTDSLNDFFECIIAYLKIRERFEEEIWMEDDSLKPDFVECVRRDWAGLIGEERALNFVEYLQ